MRLFRTILAHKLIVAGLFVAGSLGAMPLRAETLEIYIDADYSISRDAAESIELGVRTALAQSNLAQSNNADLDFEIAIVPRNHRGNVRRSFSTMEAFLASERALVMIGGLHSPPYLTHRDFINENGLLLLLPWSAAGPVTRANQGDENWIFRVSVDDAQTPQFFIRETLEQGTCESLALLLVDTGWGRGFLVSITDALESRLGVIAITRLFPTSITEGSARLLAEDIARSGADCAILLANWNNGAEMVNTLNERIPDLRVFSHWGILGGGFAAQVPHETRVGADLHVLQTCGLREQSQGNTVLSGAINAAGLGRTSLRDVPASTGFVHGYDLTLILVSAIEQAMITPDWNGDITAKRRAVRAALEDLNRPVAGILRTYVAPFSRYSVSAPDAHEALGLNDLCMTAFDADGRLDLTD